MEVGRLHFGPPRQFLEESLCRVGRPVRPHRMSHALNIVRRDLQAAGAGDCALNGRATSTACIAELVRGEVNQARWSKGGLEELDRDISPLVRVIGDEFQNIEKGLNSNGLRDIRTLRCCRPEYVLASLQKTTRQDVENLVLPGQVKTAQL